MPSTSTTTIASTAFVAVLIALALRSPEFLNLRRFNKVSYSFPSDVVNLTRRLLESGETEPSDFVAAWLSDNNFSVSLHEPLPGRFNILALTPGARISDARVLLFTHLDVVPGGPKLDLNADNHRIVGRGSTDARGIAASMMIAAAYLRDPRVALLLVTDEEKYHTGIKHAALNLDLPKDIILFNGEPTESKLATAQKGILRINLAVKGIPCHSGYPHLGHSAIEELLDVLAVLRATDWPCVDQRCTTMNIGLISGGEAVNIVPGGASAGIAFRAVTDPRDLLKTVRGIINRFKGVHIDDYHLSSPISFFVPPKAAARYGTAAVSYNTDIAAYATIPAEYKRAVLFGASTIMLAHTDHESIGIDDLESMPEAYKVITEELLEIDEEERAIGR